MHKISKNQHFIFHQNGSRAHTTKDTIEYLTDCSLEIITPAECPPISADLNPLGYLICSIVDKIIYQKRISKAEYLTKRIPQSCQKNIQERINRYINQLRTHQQKKLAEESRRFENLL